MGNERCMTIKELADELQISKDKIKYRVGKLPSNYLVKKDGITYIKIQGIQAIRDFYRVNSPGKFPDNYPPFTHQEKLIEMLQKELDQKNQQIENLHSLLNHEQQLRMVVEQKLLPNTSFVEEEKTENNSPISSDTEEQTQKKWWQFWK